MSKAEERALEAYPPKLVTYSDLFGEETLDDNSLKRIIFIKGYTQAEKDNELTWEDIRIILDAENDILNECNNSSKLVIETYPKGENYYGEILKRFKEKR